jgi:hypothetical protein
VNSMTRPRLVGARWARRSTSAVGAAVAAVVIGGGATVLSGGAAAAVPAAPGGCPATAPGRAVAVPLGEGPVLYGGVVSMRLCRFGGLPTRSLQGGRVIRGHAVIGSLYRQLNALLPVSPAPTSCPADFGSEVLLAAHYRGGRTATVTIELSGCRTVIRGRTTRSAEISPGGAALLAQLVRLTP